MSESQPPRPEELVNKPPHEPAPSERAPGGAGIVAAVMASAALVLVPVKMCSKSAKRVARTVPEWRNAVPSHGSVPTPGVRSARPLSEAVPDPSGGYPMPGVAIQGGLRAANAARRATGSGRDREDEGQQPGLPAPGSGAGGSRANPTPLVSPTP